MPKFIVVAREKFVVRTTYEVEAATPEESTRLIQAGSVPYDRHEIEEGGEEFIETVSVEPTGREAGDRG